MAAVGPKAAPLADDLKDYAQSLAPTAFPKNFFCASCSELAIDSWKLLCCNKVVCDSCHAKLEFPTTCPLCDHSPLEAESCIVNKSLRNTMRVWLQKQKKKDEAKGTPTIATPVEPTSTPAEARSQEPPAEKPVETVESAVGEEGTPGQDAGPTEKTGGDGGVPSATAVPQTENVSAVLQDDGAQRDGSVTSQGANPSDDPTAASAGANESAPPKAVDGQADGMYENNGMASDMNGMNGQYGFGFQNQANFNGMGMGGMSNMMEGSGWNGMNPMDFNMNMSNMPNSMYGGFGGNMGMSGMNDMSAMMYGGNFGNGWQGGMNGGFENFNGYNPMGAYNQSGAPYGQMMNQFPKNNFPNQNRFPANGAAFPQQNSRRGSQGKFGNQNGPGFQHATNRPGSRNGPTQDVRRNFHNPAVSPRSMQRRPFSKVHPTDNHRHLQRDGEAPAGTPNANANPEAQGEQTEAPTEAPQEGKAGDEGTQEHDTTAAAHAEGGANETKTLTETADQSNDTTKSDALNAIQTVDSDAPATFERPMMNGVMPPMQPFAQGMMGGFAGPGQTMNMPYAGNMGFGHHHGYGSSGAYNPAYGSATVLTGEPRGIGVEGAPTGPRAMREGRPNTGFSSRINSARYNSRGPTPSVTSVRDTVSASPARRGRSSPERDDTLRTKDKSPSRSRSPQAKEASKPDEKDRSRSGERESRQRPRDRSRTPEDDERNKDRRHHRSSRYDDYDSRDERRGGRDEDYDRHRDEKETRGDRTRSASVESRYRSRRDKEKYRSSRSHRERSREHRRRHRSRSPVAAEGYEEDSYTNSNEESRRRHRSDKEKHRERERDRSRNREDRDRDRDRRSDRRDRDYDRDYDYEREKDRTREKDRDRKRSSRRDRDDEDDDYRSSRRSGRKDRDRDYDSRDAHETSRAVSPPANAPTGPSAEKPTESGFSIKGFSKTKRSESTAMPPPSGPRSLQPPKGPAAERDRDRREGRSEHRRNASASAPTPASPSAQDHYAAERERHTRERVDKDQRDRVLQSIHGRATGRAGSLSGSSSARPGVLSKRNRDDSDDGAESRDAGDKERERERERGSDRERDKERDREREKKGIPTGPSAHRDKRPRKDSSDAIASMFVASLRKQGKARRGGVKIEGEVERELERGEREREREGRGSGSGSGSGRW